MDEAGLHQAYLMASRFHGFDNSYCADALPLAPDRFVGVANIDILEPDAPDTISYWIEERGMHGVRFWGGGPQAGHRFPGDERGLANYVDDPKLIPAWERVRDLGVPSNAPGDDAGGPAQHAAAVGAFPRDTLKPQQPDPRARGRRRWFASRTGPPGSRGVPEDLREFLGELREAHDGEPTGEGALARTAGAFWAAAPDLVFLWPRHC